jgi:hypothetical protein
MYTRGFGYEISYLFGDRSSYFIFVPLTRMGGKS